VEEHAGSVLYRSEYDHFRTNFTLFPATEFLVEVLQHQQQSTLRLGEVHKDRPGLSVSAMESRAAWARLLAKVYVVDPLRCPRCASQIRVLAVITDAQQIRRILRHLIKTGAAPRGSTPLPSTEPFLPSSPLEGSLRALSQPPTPLGAHGATAPRPSLPRPRASRALLWRVRGHLRYFLQRANYACEGVRVKYHLRKVGKA
jgi:hypothetical protein